MTIDRLKVLHATRPFRPFVLCLTDRRTVRVQRPEFMARSPAGTEITVFTKGDSSERILVQDIQSVRIESSPSAGRDLRRRKTKTR